MKRKEMTNLKLTAQQGLTTQEASQRLNQYGSNQLVAAKKASIWRQIGHHLADVSSLVLLFAVGLASYMALFQGGGWTKSIVIGAILVINVIIGMYQEASAEKALAALQSMSLPTTTVRREDIAQSIDAKDVVPGDLVLLKAGDQVPADGIVLSGTNLAVDEAVLTGESVPVDKVALQKLTGLKADQQVFSGTAVTAGTAVIQVVTTGMATELGQIAGLLNKTKKRATPLQGRLNRLSGWLTAFAVMGGMAIFALSIWMQNQGLADSLMIGISLAVAAVPETLPIIVTISLAHGVKRMATRNAIMRRVNAVETIGGVDVIASDKTGTLTQNQMTITRYWTPQSPTAQAASELTHDGRELMRYLGLATNAEIQTVNGEEETVGDPTELAIVRWLAKNAASRKGFEESAPRLAENPFDSTKKTMATLHQLKDGRRLVVVKGAFDRLPVAWPAGGFEQAKQIHDAFGQQALRVLAVGYKVVPAGTDVNWETLTQGLTFAGLVGMIDPPRPEVITAIREAKAAGIKPIMITGDHMVTAEAIAKEIELLSPGQLVMSGDELRTLTDAELAAQIKQVAVYARVSPTDKIRIVQAWQKTGATVAMTGDGVNDAPALKAADVGIAMGITGTEVSKSAADMVLTDDNFATIISAVKEGRTVYQNILKAVEFLVGVNFAQIFLMVGAVLMGWGAPLLAEQLLLINVLADGIPGFYLSREPGEKAAMKQSPVANDESLFARGLGGRLATRAVTFTLLTLGAYGLGRFVLSANQPAIGMTVTFLILAIGSMIDIYAIKDRQPLTWASLKRNPRLNQALFVMIGLLIVVAVVPGLQGIFGLVTLPLSAWAVVAVGVFVPTAVLELKKRWGQRRQLQTTRLLED